MIAITFDLATEIAKLAFTLPITAGADVPVSLTFTAAPGEVSAVQVGLVEDDATPATLAYTEDFAAENANTWSALLDANDSRLITALAGKTTLQVILALVLVIDGARLVNTALRITVNQAVLTGPESSEGGPSYYTEGQVNTIANELETETALKAYKTVATKYRIKNDGTFQLWNPDQSKWHALSLSGAAGAETLSIAAGE